MMTSQHDITFASAWQVGTDWFLPLDRPRLMGVLNVTPDSFSDGGQNMNPARAIGRALRMINEGAEIIDIGGESTRPGAQRISDAQQIDRTVPIIEELHRHADVLISIDTTRAAVAEAALDAGAKIINDVAAGRDDESMLSLAASRDCGLVLMHRLQPPGEDSYSDRYHEAPEYQDVVAEVSDFLNRRADEAIKAGVNPASIVIDPGLGFGKTVEQNYQLITHGAEFVETGYPVLSAASRKSFIGTISDVEVPAERVFGSVAVSVAQWLMGVRLFRVHDVAQHAQALAVAQQIAPNDREISTSP